MIRLPKFEPVKNEHYKDYYLKIHWYNKTIHEILSDRLADLFTNCDDYVFLITGSDARFEKGPLSPVELILIKNSKNGHYPSMHNLNHKLKRSKKFETLESKIINKDILSYYRNDPERVFPSRMIDSKLLCGRLKLYNQTVDGLLNEFINKDIRKRINKKLKRRKKEYGKATATGMNKFKGKNKIHYDLESGIAIFDPNKGQGSFKYGPLRYLQTELTRNVVKHLNQKRTKSFFREYPSSTVERLEYFKDQDLVKIPDTDLLELQDNYQYFLWMYHLSEEAYHNTKRKRIRFDKKEVKKRIENTLEVTKDGIFK